MAGGNHTRSGEGSADFGGVGYNGEQLVPRGVVLVSVNSRLVKHLCYNAGHEIDQIGACRCIQWHAAAFP
jgi:hypothetical protein